jgi:hypothetical protein
MSAWDLDHGMGGKTVEGCSSYRAIGAHHSNLDPIPLLYIGGQFEPGSENIVGVAGRPKNLKLAEVLRDGAAKSDDSSWTALLPIPKLLKVAIDSVVAVQNVSFAHENPHDDACSRAHERSSGFTQNQAISRKAQGPTPEFSGVEVAVKARRRVPWVRSWKAATHVQKVNFSSDIPEYLPADQ